MADEVKTTEPEVQNQAEEITPKNESTQTVEGGNADDVKQEDVDYKEELKAQKALVDHKEKVILEQKRAIEALKRKKSDDEEPSSIDLDIEEKVAEIKRQNDNELERIKQSMVEDVIDDEVNRVSSSLEEAELIRFHLEHSVKIGDYSRYGIRDAVETAKLKANKKKIVANIKEISEALKAKATLRTSADTSGVKQPSIEKPKLSREDIKFLERYGVKT